MVLEGSDFKGTAQTEVLLTYGKRIPGPGANDPVARCSEPWIVRQSVNRFDDLRKDLAWIIVNDKLKWKKGIDHKAGCGGRDPILIGSAESGWERRSCRQASSASCILAT